MVLGDGNWTECGINDTFNEFMSHSTDYMHSCHEKGK